MPEKLVSGSSTVLVIQMSWVQIPSLACGMESKDIVLPESGEQVEVTIEDQQAEDPTKAYVHIMPDNDDLFEKHSEVINDQVDEVTVQHRVGRSYEGLLTVDLTSPNVSNKISRTLVKIDSAIILMENKKENLKSILEGIEVE